MHEVRIDLNRDEGVFSGLTVTFDSDALVAMGGEPVKPMG